MCLNSSKSEPNTKLFILTEYSAFMMGFVFITKNDNVVIVDGGGEKDMPQLLELIGDKKISAWILTHPHFDHISGFSAIIRDESIRNRVEKIYHHFPSEEFVKENEPDDLYTLKEYQAVHDLIKEKEVIVFAGDEIFIDELHIKFLFCGNGPFFVNDTSIAFKVTADGMRSVLFLGDLGPCGGRGLLEAAKDDLPSDIVQMSHHGHMGVTKEVYEAISPTACMWCAPEWLWNEEPIEIRPEMWGTIKTREWMEDLGVKEHYISKDGLQQIKLFEN